VNKEMNTDILHCLKERSQKEIPQKMENHQLVSPSLQCSSTPVSFGQRFLLAKQQCDNTETSPPKSDLAPADFYLFPPLKSAFKGTVLSFVMLVTS
jgi:hypothetical protein